MRDYLMFLCNIFKFLVEMSHNLLHISRRGLARAYTPRFSPQDSVHSSTKEQCHGRLGYEDRRQIDRIEYYWLGFIVLSNEQIKNRRLHGI
jgi:hypothetical protein